MMHPIERLTIITHPCWIQVGCLRSSSKVTPTLFSPSLKPSTKLFNFHTSSQWTIAYGV